MAKALTSRAPLWNGRRMGTVCSYANHRAAGREIKALGFSVKESNDFKPLDRNAHSAYTNGGWHYAYKGTGAFDINWQHEGANTWVETMLIDLYVIPILRKYGVKGIIHKPRNRSDHKTWCHADRGSYNDYTVRSWNASQKRRAASLIAKYRTGGGGSAAKPAAKSKTQVFRISAAAIKRMQKVLGTTQDGKIDPKDSLVIRALQKKAGTTQDGYLSDPSQLGKKIQRFLNSLRDKKGKRYFALNVDGHIDGPATTAALERYLLKLNGKFTNLHKA